MRLKEHSRGESSAKIPEIQCEEKCLNKTSVTSP